MKARESISYQDLKDIMTATVKRGRLRRRLGDREHTVRINDLLDLYIAKEKKQHNPSPTLSAKVSTVGQLTDILTFHQFTLEFDEIMRGPLEGKSSVTAARKVQTAIDESQQKYLANAFAPFAPLFDRSFFYTLRAFYTDYDHYKDHLLSMVNAILTPNDAFDLENLLQTINLNTYRALAAIYLLMNKDHAAKGCVALIQKAAETNPLVRHTLQLATFFNAFRSILESRMPHGLTSPLSDGTVQWLMVMYREVHPYFNEDNQGVYQETLLHYTNALRRFEAAPYSELITPDFFNLDRLLKIRGLLSAIVDKNQIGYRATIWPIETAYYLHFNFSNINPPLTKQADDFIYFLETLVGRGLIFLARSFLTLLTASDHNPGLHLSQARHKRAALAAANPDYQPALFGDIITPALFTIINPFNGMLFSIKQDPTVEALFFSIMNQLSKTQGALTEKVLRELPYRHTSLLTSFNTLLTQQSLSSTLLATITTHLFSPAIKYDRKSPAINCLNKLHTIQYPITELNFNALTGLCGFNAAQDTYEFREDCSTNIMNIVDRLAPICATLVLDTAFNCYYRDPDKSKRLIATISLFLDRNHAQILTQETLKLFLRLEQEAMNILVNVYRFLTPPNTPPIIDALAHDDPNQPQAVFRRMLQHHEKLGDVFLRGELLNAVARIPTHLTSVALLSTIVNFAIDQNAAEAQASIEGHINALLIRDQITQPAQRLNPAQSTHTRSVHDSVSASAIALRAYFADHAIDVDVDQNLNELEKDLRDRAEPTKKFANDPRYEFKLAYLRDHAAHQLVLRIQNGGLGLFTDPTSRMTLRELLAFAYECMQTPDIRTFSRGDETTYTVEEQDARERLYEKLYEAERNYNLNDDDIDDLKESRPACAPGTFNKGIEGLHTVVNVVNVEMLTKAVALLQLKASIEQALMDLLEAQPRDSAEEKTKLDALIKKLKDEGPGFLMNQLLEPIKANYTDRFKKLYQNGARVIDELQITIDVSAGIEYFDTEPLLKKLNALLNLNTPSVTSVGLFAPTAPAAPDASTNQPRPNVP